MSAQEGLAQDGLPPLREVVERHGLMAQKALGQNFLFDLNLTGKIARAAGPLAGQTVVEIGPGPGGLTRALLANGAGRVIAIERDRRCLPALAEIAAHYPGRPSERSISARASSSGKGGSLSFSRPRSWANCRPKMSARVART